MNFPSENVYFFCNSEKSVHFTQSNKFTCQVSESKSDTVTTIPLLQPSSVSLITASCFYKFEDGLSPFQ